MKRINNVLLAKSGLGQDGSYIQRETLEKCFTENEEYVIVNKLDSDLFPNYESESVIGKLHNLRVNDDGELIADAVITNDTYSLFVTESNIYAAGAGKMIRLDDMILSYVKLIKQYEFMYGYIGPERLR